MLLAARGKANVGLVEDRVCMIYEKLRTVQTADELLDQAFRRAVRSAMSGSGRVVNIQRAMIIIGSTPPDRAGFPEFR